MKPKLISKWENYKEKVGTYNKMISADDKANQSRAEETNIKLMIEKYGIMPLYMMDSAKEKLYLDERLLEGTLQERLEIKQEINDYFTRLPAEVRKSFKDSAENFYQGILYGDLERYQEKNIFSEEHVKTLTEYRTKSENRINELEKMVQNLTSQFKTGEQLNGKTQIDT